MYITELHIENLKLLRDFHLSFGTPEEPRMWTVLVGENGLCKTTILQAVALAAGGEQFSNALARSQIPSLADRRRASATMTIEAKFYTGLGLMLDQTHPMKPQELAKGLVASKIQLEKGKRLLQGELTLLVDRGDLPGRPPGLPIDSGFVAAYGSARSLEHALDRALARKNPRDPFERLRSLFDDKSIVGSGFSYLLKAPDLFNDMLRRIIEETQVLPRIGDVEFRGRNWVETGEDAEEGDKVRWEVGGEEKVEIPATWLSQGYQSALAWIADLVGQFLLSGVASLRGSSLEVARDHFRGLVLIDEIDLHLHPAWQAILIPQIKKIFPLLQFVVTTHSPLILTSLKPEEIVILRQDDEGSVIAKEISAHPALLTGSEIYERYFGVERTQAGRLGLALGRYRALALEGDELEDDERDEMKELHQELVGAGIDPDQSQARG